MIRSLSSKISGFLAALLVVVNLSAISLPVAYASTEITSSQITSFEGQMPNGNWTSGNLCQGGGDCYSEGDEVAHRVGLDDLVVGEEYTLSIKLDYYCGSGIVGYQEFNDIAGTGVSSLMMSNPTQVENELIYQVTFTADSTTAMLNWDALLSDQAADCSGSHLHVGIDGSTKTVPLPVSELNYLPGLNITKVVEGGDAPADIWSFAVTSPDGTVTVYDIADGQDTVMIDNLQPGVYTISEVGGDTNYMFDRGSGNSCSFESDMASATLISSTTKMVASCTFVNAYQGQADLFIDKVDDIADDVTVSPGDTINYTITYGNQGDKDNQPLSEVITETIPVGTIYVDNGLWVCSDQDGDGIFNAGDTCVADSEDLVAGSEYTIVFSVMLEDDLDTDQVTSIYNVVTMADKEGEEITPTEPGTPVLSIIKDDGLVEVEAGQVISYQIFVQNIGTADATNVTVADMLPEYVSLIGTSNDLGIGAPTVVDGVIVWPAFNLMEGSFVTFTVTVQVDEQLPDDLESITNIASVFSDQTEEISDDDVDQVNRGDVLGETDDPEEEPGEVLGVTLVNTGINLGLFSLVAGLILIGSLIVNRKLRREEV